MREEIFFFFFFLQSDSSFVLYRQDVVYIVVYFCFQFVEFGKNTCISWRWRGNDYFLKAHPCWTYREEKQGRKASYITRLIPDTWISCEQKNLDMLYFEEMIWRQYYLLFYQKKKKMHLCKCGLTLIETGKWVLVSQP